MAPKRSNVREATPVAASPAPVQATAPPTPKPVKASTAGAQNWDKVIMNVVNHYVNTTPQRTKLIDVFLGFLAVVGALQFLYCILAGNFVSYCLFCDED
jgi:oligosaccharyltransferase complex subunit epsilon